jgi:hypothetical protein
MLGRVMSVATRRMLGLTLLTVPTIVYGGLTVLGIVTSGAAGLPPPLAALPSRERTRRRGGRAVRSSKALLQGR